MVWNVQTPLSSGLTDFNCVYFVFSLFIFKMYWNTWLLLCRLYSSLETTTEPHRLTASLECVVCVARALVRGGKHYPEGQTHVIPLLIQTLPGIDPNDIKKCMVRISMSCTHFSHTVAVAYFIRAVLCFRCDWIFFSQQVKKLESDMILYVKTLWVIKLWIFCCFVKKQFYIDRFIIYIVLSCQYACYLLTFLPFRLHLDITLVIY